MKKLTVFTIVIALILSGLAGCRDTKTEERLKRLEEENSELREKLEQSERDEPVAPSPYTGATDNPAYVNTPDPYVHQPSKYVFVLLTVTQREYAENYMGKVTKVYNYCSGIQELSYVDEDVKYKLMDRVQASYQSSAGATLYDGEVTDRKTFVFDSYEEASKEREKYLVNR